MRCTVPTNVPPSEKILKLYDAGRSGGGGITGRPWPGSLHTIRGAPGSLKHVQPALISVLGVKPSAVAAVAIPSETATAAIKNSHRNEGTRFRMTNGVGTCRQAGRGTDGFSAVDRVGRVVVADRAAAAEGGAALPLSGPQAAA